MIEMQGIDKSFGDNQVLKGIDLTIKAGEVLALLGENGAGKSTLMNILGGVLPSDNGRLVINGQQVSFSQPKDSLAAGIAFIHQELSLINDLPIYENIFLGNELKKKYGILDLDEMYQQTVRLFETMALDLDPRLPVSALDASYKQIVEISRALMMDAAYIIMDEPTTSLTEPEIKRVFAMIERLKKQGIGIVFISHKLNEVLAICDHYTVLRDGSVVASGRVAEVTTEELAHEMVGHTVRTETLQVAKSVGEVVLELEGLTLEPYFREISLTLKKGEILGVTGLMGDGRSELFQAVFGSLTNWQGKIKVAGKEAAISNIQTAMAHGLAYLPKNRKENGIIPDMTILENASVVIWPKHAHFGVIAEKKNKQVFASLQAKLNIKMTATDKLITSLSGGNQQKVIFAKWLSTKPRILILDNPTQGVDVGSKEEIYDIILALAQEGVGVIILSNEPQEVMRVCDRTLVMYHGAIQGELAGAQMTEQGMMSLATGGTIEEKVGEGNE